MKTDWDYSTLANAYLKRPDYSNKAIDKIIEISQVKDGGYACDIGAGVAHLTLMLLKKNLNVVAIEPNDAMRTNGIARTSQYAKIKWVEGVGENTGLPASMFDIVTFGSSFNVLDKNKALQETKRILKPRGWFACMWNHRDIADKIQSEIELIIKNRIPNYNYGTRREDQSDFLNQTNLFSSLEKIEESVIHEQTIEECIEAWKSHATLERQAENKYPQIISEIEKFLFSLKITSIKIPYLTRVWLGRYK